jgi:hypothetical protein
MNFHFKSKSQVVFQIKKKKSFENQETKKIQIRIQNYHSVKLCFNYSLNFSNFFSE